MSDHEAHLNALVKRLEDEMEELARSYRRAKYQLDALMVLRDGVTPEESREIKSLERLFQDRHRQDRHRKPPLPAGGGTR